MAIGKTEADQDYLEVMKTLGSVVDTAVDELQGTAAHLREASSKQREVLSIGSWQVAVDQAKIDYERLVGELKSEGVTDPTEYGKLVQERQRLTEKMKVLESKKEECVRRVAESQECHRQIQAARRAISQARERFLDQESACRGARVFGGHFNNYLKREFERDPTFLDRLWAWFPEDGLNVEYSRQGDGKDFQPIGQASAGQRSAAMLAFLLAYGAEALVLDQPEDDLDNHLIYDLVVRQIRENKLRRQIIVVTHNPNIVVNGDAEMLHAMKFSAGQCVVSQAGSLQDREIREEPSG